MKPILVTAYVSPDLDGAAGAIAYSEFLEKTGQKSIAGIIGVPHIEAKYVLDRFHIPYPKAIADTADFEQVVLVDASDIVGLEGKVEPGKVVEIIDHRRVNDVDQFPNAKVQIEFVGAAAALVAERFHQAKITPSKQAAILLYAAIISNTLNLKGSITTERDEKMALWLNEVACLPADFWRDLFMAKSDLSGDKLATMIEGDFAWFKAGGRKFGIAQIEMIGAEKLLRERVGEVVQILHKLKAELALDFVFQNTIELAKAKNFFVTDDVATQKLLTKVLGVKFQGPIAERAGLIMRKQISPLLKAELE